MKWVFSSVFHLHNTSATRELSVYLDGQRLRHECHPTYLGVTLDRTLSYREHLMKTAGKLKNRNNLLMKLAGSTWGASANTLRSSALVLCYSAAEYCAPVLSRSSHTSQVDVQLNSTMRLISGTLRSTPLPWLPVLSNIEPPALRRKAVTDKLVVKIVKHDRWPIQPDILSPPLLRLVYRRSFTVAAPVVWNSLPSHLRSPLISRGQFRAGLKTHLFKQAYSL